MRRGTFLVALTVLFAVSTFVIFLPVPKGGSLTRSRQILGVRVKSAACQGNHRPDPACTPGSLIPGLTARQVCQAGYSDTVNPVSSGLADQVFAQYGIFPGDGEYQVDHLISVNLGGSNDISNLWPQSAEPRPGFHEKDRVEDYLFRQVCAGTLTLTDAQRLLASDWIKVFLSMPSYP